ncbi:iron dicitrate transporter FecR [Nitrospira sp. KM1]|uniref:FecR family protein n=1 Tax=Nitrospira sp. KM1 TaxID=1936990 RepID=UPI0013A7120A|nr:FecR family protein [Nitrospira sp. KM1]BCA56560.1 iron dicitrate transporter FecR [Nitrospira sp. KM1]
MAKSRWGLHLSGWKTRREMHAGVSQRFRSGDGKQPGLNSVMDQALDWFLRLKQANVSTAERRSFEAWQKADARHADAYRSVVRMWDSPEFADAVMRHGQEEVASVPPKRDRNRLRSRAIIAVTVVMAIALMNVTAIRIALESDHKTGTGQREKFSLSDGSIATLNTGSAVNVQFSASTRRLELLKGETYVEVTRDPERAFELIGGQASARVLGTAFSMRRESQATIVTVKRGEVAVRHVDENSSAMLLQAGDQVRVTDNGLEPLRRVDPEEVFAWVEGRLRFHDRTLDEVVAELSRYHAGIIVIANSKLKTMRVSGNYRLDNPVAVMTSLADATHARLTRLSDYLLILN